MFCFSSRLGLLGAAGRIAGSRKIFKSPVMAAASVSGRRKASSLDGIPQSGLSDERSNKKSKSIQSQDSVVAVIVDQSDQGEETADQVKLNEPNEVSVNQVSEAVDQPNEASMNEVNEASDVNRDSVNEASVNAVKEVSVNEEDSVNAVDEVSVHDEVSEVITGESKSEKPLSKSALKKIKKMERLAEKKREAKAREKELKKERKEKKTQEWANLSAEEKQAAVERSRETRRMRYEQNNKRKEKLRAALDAGQNLVIDFQFTEQMTDQEVSNMSQQIMYCYSANAKAEVPVRLSLTSLNGKMKEQFEKIPGYTQWLVHREERPYLEIFSDRKQDLVYLTADSENVLDRFEDSKIYIIGGMVDHNRLKGVTLARATEQGISTARLPIQENIKLTSSTVLTVNQVVEIVLEYIHSKDWAKALKSIIPQRKIAHE